MSTIEQSVVQKEYTRGRGNIPFKLRMYRFLRRMLIGFLFVSVANILFSHLFYTPKAYGIEAENDELVEQYRLLENRIAAAENRLAEISHRDNYVYRALFGLDTIDTSRRMVLYPEELYSEYESGYYSPLITDSWRRIDILAQELFHQSQSLDELQLMAKNKEELSGAIPALWPIDRTKLKYGIGAFGMRLHPIYRRYIMHKGVDLACDLGSPIYATADGVVQYSVQGYRTKGYGQMVLLKHNFGYQTRYGHMSKRLVSRGDTVKRGDIIGLVGTTGGSTGPHLHYEVILRGQVVNPLNFFNRNMSKEEYQALMEQVHETKLEAFDE